MQGREFEWWRWKSQWVLWSREWEFSCRRRRWCSG